VDSVAITPTRALRVSASARRTPLAITPTMGMSNRSTSASRANDEAVLHATTSIFTPSETRNSAFWSEYLMTVSADLLP